MGDRRRRVKPEDSEEEGSDTELTHSEDSASDVSGESDDDDAGGDVAAEGKSGEAASAQDGKEDATDKDKESGAAGRGRGRRPKEDPSVVPRAGGYFMHDDRDGSSDGPAAGRR
eukprot:Opistho-2@83625